MRLLRKFLRAIPLSYFFTFLKIFWKPKRGSFLYKRIRFWDPFSVSISKRISFKLFFKGKIERTIFWSGIKGAKEKKSIELWLKLMPKSRVIFDVGANSGIYSLISASSNRNSEIHAFEPNKKIINLLIDNLKANNLEKRVHVIKKAISDKKSVTEIDDYGAAGELITTDTISLDEYVSENSIKELDLLKVDVEGFEPKVIEGAMKTIKKFRPTILIEILNDDIGEFIENKLKNLDYLFFDIDDSKNLVKRSMHIRKSSFFNYLICSNQKAKELKLIS